MPLNLSQLDNDLANFLENVDNYPLTLDDAVLKWDAALTNYINSGLPQSINTSFAMSNFRVKLIALFTSYPKTIPDFAEPFADIIYETYIDFLLGFAPTYTAIPNTERPDFLPIFSNYGINISSSCAIEIHNLFFRTKLVNNVNKKVIFFE